MSIAPGHEARIAGLDWHKQPAAGLLPAVVQHAHGGEVLMLGFMNPAALQKTLETGLVTFFSRSRNALWTKGETSGNTLRLVDVRADCDADTLLVRALPDGPVCHLGHRTCFDAQASSDDATPPWSTLRTLEAVIAERARALAAGDAAVTESTSYVARLLAKGPRKAAQKVGEEGVEVALAVVDEDDAALIGEAADLLFHLLVALRTRGLGLEDVTRELQRRRR